MVLAIPVVCDFMCDLKGDYIEGELCIILYVIVATTAHVRKIVTLGRPPSRTAEIRPGKRFGP